MSLLESQTLSQSVAMSSVLPYTGVVPFTFHEIIVDDNMSMIWCPNNLVKCINVFGTCSL